MGYKIAAIIIFCLIYVYELALSVISLKSVHNEIPDNVRDVYDQASYRSWQAYYTEKTRWGMLGGAVSFVVGLVLLAFNVYAAFAGLFPDTLFLQMLGVLILTILTGFLDLPLSYYDTMVIEEKYGFNKTTRKTFFLDELKGLVIEVVLLVGIGALVMWIHQALGVWMILVFAGVMMALALGIAFLYPVLRRIFNKFTPLEDEELQTKLSALLEKHNYKVRAVLVMDASRRSTKANAYFTGFGKMKTIVLYDTLLETMDADEVCAVFAHEMGHGLHKDTLKGQVLTFLQMLLLGVLAWLTFTVTEIYPPFGFAGLNYGFALILITGIEFAFLSPALGLLMSWVSRRAEYRADRQAVAEGYGEQLISALKKLARRDFANIAPSPLLVKLKYSHPTLSQRITAIRETEEAGK